MAELKADDFKPAYKEDHGKPPMGLLDPTALRQMAAVMGYGEAKYSRVNWRKGMDWSRVYDAVQRHLTAWNDGEDIDPESGLSHLAHAACGVMFLIYYAAEGVGRDDRFRTLLKELGKQEETMQRLRQEWWKRELTRDPLLKRSQD